MPCHVSSSAGRDACADSEVHVLEYGAVFHLLWVVNPKFTPLVYIHNAQNETGNSKMEKMEKNFDPPPPLRTPPSTPWGVGV